MKFATKEFDIFHHILKYVALSWEVKSSNLLKYESKCKQNALIFYMHPFNVTLILTCYLFITLVFGSY